MTESRRHRLNRNPRLEPIVTLVEINESGFSSFHRAVGDNSPITFESNVYEASDVKITPPGASDEEPTAKVEVSNVNLIIGRALEKLRRNLNIRIVIVDKSTDPVDVLLDTMNMFKAKSITITPKSVFGSLMMKSSIEEPVPSKRATSYLPGTTYR